jgi:hypothetical protein
VGATSCPIHSLRSRVACSPCLAEALREGGLRCTARLIRPVDRKACRVKPKPEKEN